MLGTPRMNMKIQSHRIHVSLAGAVDRDRVDVNYNLSASRARVEEKNAAAAIAETRRFFTFLFFQISLSCNISLKEYIELNNMLF